MFLSAKVMLLFACSSGSSDSELVLAFIVVDMKYEEIYLRNSVIKEKEAFA